MERDDVHDALHELRQMRELLTILTQVDSGEFITIPLPWRITSVDPFRSWKSNGGEMAAVQIDNPNANTMEIRFDGAQPTTADADDRVPAHTGRILVRRFTAISIGADPSVNIGAAALPVYVKIFSRPIAPSTYAFAP